jgi:hypothetical protein
MKPLLLGVLLVLAGCTGVRVLDQPLGPVKGDKLPMCDTTKKDCVKT